VKRIGQLKPSEADKKLTHVVEEAFPDESGEAMELLVKRSSRKRTFQLARKESKPSNISPYRIPSELMVIFLIVIFLISYFQLSRVVVKEKTSYVLRYYEDDIERKPFVILSDRVNLKALHGAPVLIADGTFAFCPSSFSQLYVIHAVYADLPDRQSNFVVGKFSIIYFINNYF